MGRKKKVYSCFNDYSKTMRTLCLKLKNLNECDKYALLSHYFSGASRYSKKEKDKATCRFLLSKELLTITEFNNNLNIKMFNDPTLVLANIFDTGYDEKRNRFFSEKINKSNSIIYVIGLCPSLKDNLKNQAILLANCYNAMIKEDVKKINNFDFRKSKNITFSKKQSLFEELAQEINKHSTYAFRDLVVQKDKKLYKIIKNANSNGRSLELIIYACSRLLFVYKNNSLNIIPNHISKVIKDFTILKNKKYTKSTLNQMRSDLRLICYAVAHYVFKEQYNFKTVKSTYSVFTKEGEQSKLIVVEVLNNSSQKPKLLDFLVNNYHVVIEKSLMKTNIISVFKGRYHYDLIYEHLLI